MYKSGKFRNPFRKECKLRMNDSPKLQMWTSRLQRQCCNLLKHIPVGFQDLYCFQLPTGNGFASKEEEEWTKLKAEKANNEGWPQGTASVDVFEKINTRADPTVGGGGEQEKTDKCGLRALSSFTKMFLMKKYYTNQVTPVFTTS